VSATHPPRGSFSVWQRLLRGYGPLAVLAALLALMSVLVPSKVQDGDDAGSLAVDSGTAGDGFTSGSDEPAAGPGGSTSGGTGTSAGSGAAGPGGTGGGAPGEAGAAAPGGAGPASAPAGCGDRKEQVPGDPYSPPCVAWPGGDNGGATAKGVTAKDILVSYRVLNEKGFQQTLAALAGASLNDTPQTVRTTVSALAEYFNKRFELYGRQIKIAFYDGKGSNTNELLGKGRDKAEADAIKVAQEIGAFADLSATSEPYADALADRGVIGFGTPYLSRKWHEDRAPRAWSLATDGTRVSELAAEYGVKRLYGKNADYAGGDLKGKPRRFATLAPENSWYQESVENARKVYVDAGLEPGMNVKYVLDIGTMSNQAANIVPKLKSAGITTLVCGCDPVLPVFLTGVMDRERYYPEFVVVGTALTDADIVGQLWDKEYMANGQVFGVSSLTDFVPATETIAYQAFKEIRPNEEPAFSVDLIYYQM